VVKNVLILTDALDAHAPPVIEEIRRRGATTHCFDLADFPERVRLQAHPPAQGTLQYQDQTIKLEALTSIWWRRPHRYKAPEWYEPGLQEFLERETYRGFIGVLESSPALWVSRTTNIRRAELKALQLATAQKMGLRVPRTLITNDPEAVRAFSETCQGKIIVKPIARGIIEGKCPEKFLFTNVVQEHHLEPSILEGVRSTAHLFQEMVAKELELRVVVIGRHIFAVEIHSQQSERTRLDWRRWYPDLSYGIHHLPASIENRLFQLVLYFDLQYASMDLILTPDGDYVWLELNPNGQFYWLQREVPHLHLKEAMADLLTSPEEYCL